MNTRRGTEVSSLERDQYDKFPTDHDGKIVHTPGENHTSNPIVLDPLEVEAIEILRVSTQSKYIFLCATKLSSHLRIG